MIAHPQGLILFCTHAWSMSTGPMLRGFHALARERQGGGRCACVSDAPLRIPPDPTVTYVRVDGSRAGWDRAMCGLVAQGFEIFALTGRDSAEVLCQAITTSLEDRFVLTNVPLPDVLPTLPWLFSHPRVHAEEIAQQLVGILGTRRFRRVCPHCAVLQPPDDIVLALAAAHGDLDLQPGNWVRGKGCSACHGIGYTPHEGWFDLVEAIYVDRELARICAAQSDAASLRTALREHGFRTYFEQGVALVNEGLTTIDEALRVGLARRADL
jgi:hypothetical protein